MSDNFIAWLISVMAFVACVVGTFLGEKRENTRLYDKCTTTHKALPHQDVVVLCKDQVK